MLNDSGLEATYLSVSPRLPLACGKWDGGASLVGSSCPLVPVMSDAPSCLCALRCRSSAVCCASLLHGGVYNGRLRCSVSIQLNRRKKPSCAPLTRDAPSLHQHINCN